jgi:hypothetical protein
MNSISMTYALVFALTLTACDGSPGIEPVNRKPHAEFVAALKGAGQERIAQGMQTLFDADGAGKLTPRTSPLLVTTHKTDGTWTVSALDDDKVASTLLIGDAFQGKATPESRSMPSFDQVKATATAARLKACGVAYYPDVARGLIAAGFKRWYSGDASFMLPSVSETARARRQHEIDSNVVEMQIDGKAVRIAQGDLRGILEKRIRELKVERDRLSKSGDKAGLRKTDDMIRKYEGEARSGVMPAAPANVSLDPVFADVFVNAQGQFAVLAVDKQGACMTIAAGDGFGVNDQRAKD